MICQNSHRTPNKKVHEFYQKNELHKMTSRAHAKRGCRSFIQHAPKCRIRLYDLVLHLRFFRPKRDQISIEVSEVLKISIFAAIDRNSFTH